MLADASIVTLALPALLRELHTTVEGVAAVLGAYTVVLAIGVPAAAAAIRRRGAARVGRAGFVVFAVASAACGAAGSLAVLLVFRCVQAAGGSAGLIAAFSRLGAGDEGSPGRRLWVTAAVFGTAVGPVLGGVLTQALDWRAIFIAGVPVGLAAAVAFSRDGPVEEAAPAPDPEPEPEPARPPAAPLLALGLVSAALTAVLFLLVLLLVAGWSITPLAAAATVTILPGAALLAYRLAADRPGLVVLGCVLLGAGILCLAFLPYASVAWTFVPQALAGAGMGLTLPVLAGRLLPERTTGEAAVVLSVRHAGIALALLLLAPIVSSDLSDATERARVRGTALVLDAPLPPQDKISLAPALLASVKAKEPRAGLRREIAAHRDDFSGEQRAAFDRLGTRADETLVAAVGEAFRTAFLITGGFALLAAAVLAVARAGGRLARDLAIAAAVSLAVPIGYVGLHAALAPEAVKIGDPCHPRAPPTSGGLSGILQQGVILGLDRIACHDGSTREELVLGLADEGERRHYERKYGVDPRSPGGILGGLLGG